VNLEDAFLASVLAHPAKAHGLTVPPEAFAQAHARQVWQKVLELRLRGMDPDPVLVATEVQPEYVQRLARMGTTEEVEVLAEKLKAASHLRRVQHILRQAQQAKDANEALGILAQAFEGGAPEGPVALGEALRDLAARPTPQRYPVGIPPLDRILGGGLRRQTMTLVGARPSVGKTAFMLSMAAHMAQRGIPCLVVEVEQSTEEDAERLTAILGNLHLLEVQGNRALAQRVPQDLPLYLWDGARTAEDVVGMAYRMAVRGVEVVFVDYLQLLVTRDRARSPVDQVSHISRSLKLLAKAAPVALVALSQLSRESERRDDRRPRLSDLRESGSLEQDADVVLLLHRNREDPREARTLHIHVAKNRHGPVGEVTASFDLETQRVLPSPRPPLEEAT
jgi:replicative DNA helicase